MAMPHALSLLWPIVICSRGRLNCIAQWRCSSCGCLWMPHGILRHWDDLVFLGCRFMKKGAILASYSWACWGLLSLWLPIPLDIRKVTCDLMLSFINLWKVTFSYQITKFYYIILDLLILLGALQEDHFVESINIDKGNANFI